MPSQPVQCTHVYLFSLTPATSLLLYALDASLKAVYTTPCQLEDLECGWSTFSQEESQVIP